MSLVVLVNPNAESLDASFGIDSERGNELQALSKLIVAKHIFGNVGETFDSDVLVADLCAICKTPAEIAIVCFASGLAVGDLYTNQSAVVEMRDIENDESDEAQILASGAN